MTTSALSFDRVTRSFGAPGSAARHVLREAVLEVPHGRVVAIVGRSGSGKSTLLHLAAGIDRPTAGRVLVDGRDVGAMTDGERTLMRRDHIGLVFQFFHLLPHLSVRDNVALPDLIAGGIGPAHHRRVTDLLARVGLDGRADDPVQRLSGGEQQRVAICRALLRGPALLLADEPTGNLDDAGSAAVMDLMLQLTREERRTLVYVTHSRDVAALADERLRLHDGLLEPA